MMLELVRKYGLKWSLSRKITLFSSSCIGKGYIDLLPQFIGFSYRAIGIIVENKEIQSLVNDEYIAQQTEKYLEKNTERLQQLFALSDKKFVEFQSEVVNIENSSDPFEALHGITQLYPKYCALLGVHNCFWRYLGNRDKTEFLSNEQVAEIGELRDKIASLYPRIEKVFLSSSSAVAKSCGLDSDDLHYLTLYEFIQFLKKGKLDENFLAEVKKRKKRAFYFLEQGKEPVVITDEKVIAAIANEVLPKPLDQSSLVGHPVFVGRVQGKVFNAREMHRSKMEEGNILVTSMTSPADITLVKKSKAIITDEGGVLCHAAVIARELKIPCVVGTKNATKVFKTGDLVEVDAEKGIVKLVT